MPGKRSQNGPSRRGTKYFAVVVTASLSRPCFNPFKSATVILKRSRLWKMVSHSVKSSRPASVRWTRRPKYSSSGSPTLSSRFFT